MGSSGETDRAGGGSRSSTVACISYQTISNELGIGLGLEDEIHRWKETHPTVLISPWRLLSRIGMGRCVVLAGIGLTAGEVRSHFTIA